jgi:hypothetical protein
MNSVRTVVLFWSRRKRLLSIGTPIGFGGAEFA